jgi:hypothetical protein
LQHTVPPATLATAPLLRAGIRRVDESAQTNRAERNADAGLAGQ